MTSRRDFLQTVAAASAAAAIPAKLFAAPRMASLDRIGLQLYTVRKEMTANVEGTIEHVAAVGYRELEFAGYFGREPAKLRELLDRLKLTAPSSHVSIKAVEAPEWEATATAAKAMGHRWLVVPSLPKGSLESVSAIKATAARFNEIGSRVHDAGMHFAFHNHSAEIKPVEGAVPLDILLAQTDPKLVSFEMDIYWVTMAGGDPLALFSKYPGRFRLVHAKDSGGAPGHEMRDVGAGTIDWKKVFAQRKHAGIEHVFVEHDQPKDAYASIAASYAYLKALKF